MIVLIVGFPVVDCDGIHSVVFDGVALVNGDTLGDGCFDPASQGEQYKSFGIRLHHSVFQCL